MIHSQHLLNHNVSVEVLNRGVQIKLGGTKVCCKKLQFNLPLSQICLYTSHNCIQQVSLSKNCQSDLVTLSNYDHDLGTLICFSTSLIFLA